MKEEKETEWGAYLKATGMIVVVAYMHPALAVITDSASATIAAHVTDVILVGTFMDTSVVHAHLAQVKKFAVASTSAC